jgi:hypothetical protein
MEMPETDSAAVRRFPAPRRGGWAVRVSLEGIRGGNGARPANRPSHLPEPLERRQFLSVSMQDGWHVVTPEDGARVIHVSSSSGNDGNPGTRSKPVKSIKKARSMVRSGAGDQVLLQRGNVWKESLGNWSVSGKSSDEPLVLGAYGTGERPRIESVDGFYLLARGGGVHDIMVMGLHLKSPGGGTGMRVLGKVDNLLVEDCKFERFRGNISLEAGVGPVTDVTVRRSVITDALPIGSGHAYGLYADKTDRLTLEDNVFDHNGWGSKPMGAMNLSHNAYITSTNSNFVARGNTFANAAGHGLQARSGGIIENNLFYNNPRGLSFGVVHGDGPTKAGGVTGRIDGNVFIGAESTSSRRVYIGLEIANTKAGGGTLIANNLFAHGNPSTRDAAIALEVGSSKVNGSQAVGINDVTIRDNVVRDWNRALSYSPNIKIGSRGPTALNNLRILENDFPLLGANLKPSGTKPPYYGAPKVTVAAYSVSTGLGRSDQDFLNKARQQSKGVWNSRYEATAVVDYLQGAAVQR